MSGAWRDCLPSGFLKASFAFHAAAAVDLALEPRTWPLWVAGLVADHLILSTVGLVPRGTLLGPNITRLPDAAARRREVAITIDDGPHPEVTPLVLDILSRHGAKATFFCVGERVRRHAALVREICRAGHAVENHTATHPWTFSLYGIRRLTREVTGGRDAIAAATGVVPSFFRAPAGLRNPLLQPVLARHGQRLTSWTRRGFDTVAGNPDIVRARLLGGLAAGDILLLHDGRWATTPSGRPVVLEVLPALLSACRAAGLGTVTLREAFAPAVDVACHA
jgi:peptidoglycan/xylan/chitin deacetylase (PgdA/CDA1 family)